MTPVTPTTPTTPTTKRPRVVIVGGGFGGMTAAKSIARLPVEITLVDRHNFHTFSPLLYQVATSGLAPDDIAPNLRGIVQRHPNVDAVMAEVRGVDFERREVLVENGPSIPYDTLVLAAGAVSSDFGVPGVHEHTIALKNLEDAIRVRSAVLRRFEETNTDPSLLERGSLTFVVAGGGPTGVELCGALSELFSKVLAKDFKNLDVSRARVVLVEMTDHVLDAFSERSRAVARAQLEREPARHDSPSQPQPRLGARPHRIGGHLDGDPHPGDRHGRRIAREAERRVQPALRGGGRG